MKKYILICLLMFAGASMYAQNFVVIVNSANSTASINKSDLSDLFLKKTLKWKDGSVVEPVDLNSKSPVREEFSKRIHNKTTAQIRAFWQQSVFSGKSTPPRELETDQAVIQFVKSNKGAIGYISSSSLSSEVKAVKVE